MQISYGRVALKLNSQLVNSEARLVVLHRIPVVQYRADNQPFVWRSSLCMVMSCACLGPTHSPKLNLLCPVPNKAGRYHFWRLWNDASKAVTEILSWKWVAKFRYHLLNQARTFLQGQDSYRCMYICMKSNCATKKLIPALVKHSLAFLDFHEYNSFLWKK